MLNEPVEILLVEDNPSDIKLTMHAFKKRDLADRVFIVNDGEEALEYLFNRGRFKRKNTVRHLKVIFLDLKLPKVDGLEVLRSIKLDEKLKIIPVVIFTSSRQECDIVESFKLGVNSYIVKPIDFDKFITAVSELGLYWAKLNVPPVNPI